MNAITTIDHRGAPVRVISKAVLWLAFTILLAPLSHGEDNASRTKTLLDVLRSESSFFEKARACQQLGEVGTIEAVPALAELLSDPKLSAYARAGLEGIGGESAKAALRAAARKAKGPELAGIVNSLGQLRDTEAIKLLKNLASDPASGVVKESLLALGNIATPASVRIVEKALSIGPAASRNDAAAACLLAADRILKAGGLKEASVLFELIRTAHVPVFYKAAATRGAILACTNHRSSFFKEQLNSQDPAIRSAALLTIREIPDDSIAAVLNLEVVRATGDFQDQLIFALADCRNAQSLPVLQALSANTNPETRKKALLVLGRMGPDAAPALLASLEKGLAADEELIVLRGLTAMEGATVDNQIAKALNSATAPKARINLIRLLDERGCSKAAGEVFRFAIGTDKEVRLSALAALKSLASPEDLGRLIELIKSSSGSDHEIREAAENALAGVCGRCGERCSEAIVRELSKSSTAEARNGWINVLTQVGYAPALPALVKAASDPDPQVAENTLRQLGHWPNPTPIETLLTLMERAPAPAQRQQALHSVLDLAGNALDEAQASEQKITGWIQRASEADPSMNDQRRILGLLGRLKTVESFRLLTRYLGKFPLRLEAASGIVQIAPGLTQQIDGVTLKKTLEFIGAMVENKDVNERALRLSKTLKEPGGWVTLFDGRSLSGWEGDTNVWRVRDGLILGGSMNGNARNEFLASTRTYTNFVLRLEYKLVGTEGFVNSGIQFRSVRLSDPSNEMKGYQADIGAGYSGCLYDESRRNNFLVRADAETVKRLEKAGDWNQYEIRGEGPHIQIWLNGERTVDYVEPDAAIPQNGLIGLQIHGGNKAEISFRSLSILEF